jgi:hypothetical protein
MNPQEQILVALQDLDLMLKEAEDSQDQFKKLGFDVSGVEELRKARELLLGQLEQLPEDAAALRARSVAGHQRHVSGLLRRGAVRVPLDALRSQGAHVSELRANPLFPLI